MPVNVEIKTKVEDLEALRARVQTLGATPGELIRQEDTFFSTPRGRLKLRVIAADHGQLIYYERPDNVELKASHYTLYETRTPDELKLVLSQALGMRGVVCKERWLYMVGHTRVHLDRVEGLGDFLELEVMLQPGQSVIDGKVIAAGLLKRLGVAPEQAVAGAYIDLLETQRF